VDLAGGLGLVGFGFVELLEVAHDGGAVGGGQLAQLVDEVGFLVGEHPDGRVGEGAGDDAGLRRRQASRFDGGLGGGQGAEAAPAAHHGTCFAGGEAGAVAQP
jgi:hypothetical protein